MTAGLVRLHPGVARGWPWTLGIVYATPGMVLVGPTGERLRILDGGTAEEIGEVPRRWSVSADPCAIRGRP